MYENCLLIQFFNLHNLPFCRKLSTYLFWNKATFEFFCSWLAFVFSYCPIFSSSSYIPNLSFTFYCNNAMFFNLIGLMNILFIVVLLVQHRRFELLDLSFEYCSLRVFSLFQRFLVIIYILFIRICRELLREMEKWLREERLQYRYLALFSIDKIPLYIRLLSLIREIELLPINSTVNDMKIHGSGLNKQLS